MVATLARRAAPVKLPGLAQYLCRSLRQSYRAKPARGAGIGRIWGGSQARHRRFWGICCRCCAPPPGPGFRAGHCTHTGSRDDLAAAECCCCESLSLIVIANASGSQHWSGMSVAARAFSPLPPCERSEHRVGRVGVGVVGGARALSNSPHPDPPHSTACGGGGREKKRHFTVRSLTSGSWRSFEVEVPPNKAGEAAAHNQKNDRCCRLVEIRR